ncbi:MULTISPECIES: OmpH family outer membrane protein [Prevotella]|uniref:Membrane protein n=1 Tax=Prevotella herbatica TaxID=2801997 RepID=A0ABN6ELI0_9BACT|nr:MULTISPECIES: OmpH family outer membrane protein [Prevotella]MDN5552776.1 OmpH family outer membrane protein [Prevotella sp.]BCS85108.1 membrane protein [Prevotella herbatica]
MKKLFLFLAFAAFSFAASAQASLKFGYFSFENAMKQMPDYALVQHNMSDLQAKYDAETKRVEEEFNKKYEQFLDGQRDFAPTILQKRQAELQDMMEKNVAFKQEAARLLAQAQQEAYDSLKVKLRLAVKVIGDQRGYAFILNTDNDAVPYINNATGEDITDIVKAVINK